jgi:hypothetical protein
MLTKEDLDAMTKEGCGVEGCNNCGDVMFLHSRCHVGGPIEVSYRHRSGVLRVGCKKCGAVIAQIAVAEDS